MICRFFPAAFVGSRFRTPGESNYKRRTHCRSNLIQTINIAGHEALAAQVSSVVESALSQFSDHITRVEIHLSDESSHKNTPNDKRCVMEARLEGRQPVAVTEHAASVDEAVAGAAHKLAKLIESTLGRLSHRKRHRTDPAGPLLTEDV